MPPQSTSPSTASRADTAARLWAVLPCAGTGSRAGGAGPKQYQPVAGAPMVLHTLQALAGCDRLSGILVVVSQGDDFWHDRPELADRRVTVAACGGATRAQSVRNGLQALLGRGVAPSDWVLVHDAARCLLTTAMLDQLIDACRDDPVGGLLALRLPDTLKASREGRVVATVERSDKWLAQTPQMFRLGPLVQALQLTGDAVTDESSAMEAMGLQPLLVDGSAQNFKVTYPQDFALAEAVLRTRGSGNPEHPFHQETAP